MTSNKRDELLRQASTHKLRAMRFSALGGDAVNEQWQAIKLFHRAAQLELQAADPTFDLPEAEIAYARVEACGLFLNAGDPLRAAREWMRLPKWMFTREGALLGELKAVYNDKLSSFGLEWQSLRNRPVENLPEQKLKKMLSHFPGVAEFWWALSKQPSKKSAREEARARAIDLNPAFEDERSGAEAWSQIETTLIRTFNIKMESENDYTPLKFDLVSNIASAISEFLGQFIDDQFGGPGELIPIGASSGSFTFEVSAQGVPDLALELLDTLLKEAPEHVGIHRLKVLLSLLEANSVRLSISNGNDGKEEGARLIVDQPRRRSLLKVAEAAIQRTVDSQDIPQADDLNRVFGIVDLLQAQREISAETLGVTHRQVNYYRSAARILGIISGRDELTGAGRLIGRLKGEDRLRATVIQFESSVCGEAWIRWSQGQSLRDVKPMSAFDFIVAMVPGLSQETARRRAQTLNGWYKALIEHHYIATGR